jgi:hypothetical protein
MLKGVVVVEEGLLGVEGRVEVGELDLADVFALELGQPRQGHQGVQRIASDQQVVLCPRAIGMNVTDDSSVVKQANLRDPIVRRGHPLIRALLLSQQALSLVGPRQLKAAFVTGQVDRFPSPPGCSKDSPSGASSTCHRPHPRVDADRHGIEDRLMSVRASHAACSASASFSSTII